MKFLVDMPLSPELARWLRTSGHDAQHASQRSLDRAADSDIISVAARELRIVITADLDFPRLLAMAAASAPGLILLRGGNYTEAESLDCLQRVLRAIPAEDLERSIVVVDHKRIRRRWLPL